MHSKQSWFRHNNTAARVHHDTIGATEQQIWHKELSEVLNFNTKLLLRLAIASATGKQLNMSIHTAMKNFY